MIPKTKHRKRIEEERAKRYDRYFKKTGALDIFINAKEPADYFKKTVVPVEVTDKDNGGTREITATFRHGYEPKDLIRITTADFIYNSVTRQLDLYVDLD